jgi:hypothetical protein
VPAASPRAVEDRLNFSTLVTPLVALIATRTTDSPPLTVGVFGEWGTGKTCFLRLVEKGLQQNEIPSVWFNAWRYGNEEHVWVALLQRVIDQLKGSGGFIRRTIVRVKLAMLQADFGGGVRHLLSRTASFIIRLLLLVAAIVFAITANSREIAAVLGIVWSDPVVWERTIKALALVAAFFATKPSELIGVLRGVSSGIDLSRYFEGVSYRDRVAFLDQLMPFFRSVVRVSGGGKPVVVLIDDLDRCLPDKAVQILEAIALFLEVEGCVFILAVDHRMVEGAIGIRYKDLAEKIPGIRIGEGYFDKIVQLPIGIPPLADEQFERFITTLIADEDLRRCIHILKEALPRNARKCERFVDRLSFILSSRKKHHQHIVTSLLVKLVTLQDLYPSLTELLRRHPRLLEFAELHYGGEQDASADASIRTLLDEIATAVPAFKTILQMRVDSRDSFRGVNVADYVYLVDPIVQSPPAPPRPKDEKEERVAKTQLRQYADIFVRRYGQTTLPFGQGGAFPITEFAEAAPSLYARGNQVPDSRTFAQIVAAEGHVVLLGDPGSGKTTMLRQLGVETAQGEDRLPVLITFRELPRLRDGTVAEFLEVLHVHFRQSEVALGADAVRGLLASGQLLLLFDGLDEIADEQRLRAREALLAISARYPRANIVVTTRPVLYQSIGGSFHEYVIGGVADTAWYSMATVLLRASGVRKPEDFLRQVEQSPPLRELARNRLLLAMLIAVYQHTATLEQRRVDLIRRAIDIMVERWDTTRGVVASPLRGSDLHLFLTMLAEEMLGAGQLALTEQQVAVVIRNLISKTGTSVEPRVILQTALGRTGLLQEKSGRYEFSHRMFFEYLAAEAVVRTPHGVNALPQLVERQPGVVRDALLLVPSETAVKLAGQLVDGSPTAIDTAIDVALERFTITQRESLRGRIMERSQQLNSENAKAVQTSLKRLTGA